MGDRATAANINDIAFRWFDTYNKLNDRDYCNEYLKEFINEINSKNKVKDIP
jgi:hypothetical protein